jgi:hypothetical protein
MGIALVFTRVGDLFPPAGRAKRQGLFGGVYGLASVVGPSLGQQQRLCLELRAGGRHLQGVLGVSVSNSGVVITPMTLASVVGAGVGGMVMARMKCYRVVAIVGAVVLTVGAMLQTRLTPTSSVGSITLYMLYMIIGGMGFPWSDGRGWGHLMPAETGGRSPDRRSSASRSDRSTPGGSDCAAQSGRLAPPRR